MLKIRTIVEKIIFILGLILFVSSCNFEHNKKTGIVYEYMVRDNDDILFWYLIEMSDGNTYSYKSDIPVSNFRDITWSKGEPKELQDIEPEKEIEVQPEELNETMQDELVEANSADSEIVD